MKRTDRTIVAYAVSYRDPNYVRSRFLIDLLSSSEQIDLLTVSNKHLGLFRYVESLVRLALTRARHRPDIYILGFRGDEILGPVRLITAGKPLVFDEFIDPLAWLTEEHGRLRRGSLTTRIIRSFHGALLNRCALLLTDTTSHAESIRDSFPQLKTSILPLYVGADESRFAAEIGAAPSALSKLDEERPLDVFFYGTFLPLHGIANIIIASSMVRDLPVRVEIVGAASNPTHAADLVALAERLDAPIDFVDWIPLDELPTRVARADLCLAGPFGETAQAGRVVTGKTFQFLAMGKPTVVGSTDNHDLFRHRDNALVVERGDPADLAAALRWAVENADQLEAVGAAGKQLYNDRFGVDAQRSVLEAKIDQLTQASSPTHDSAGSDHSQSDQG